MVEPKEWNVIFLIDRNPPNQIVLLKRAANKAYAPGFFTGIGGKVEPGETILASAYRELKEETGIENVSLTEFARCVYQSGLRLYYFWGLFTDKRLPISDDGDFFWVDRKEILSYQIIPTTKAVCDQWAKRDFVINRPFTVELKEIGQENGIRIVELCQVKEGLI